MRCPTEEQIESVFSELKTYTCEHNSGEMCELCKFFEELNKRKLSSLDNTVKLYLESEPALLILSTLLPGSVVHSMSEFSKFMFYCGMKTGVLMNDLEKLEVDSK